MGKAGKRKPKFTRRESLGLRVTPELKQQLDEAAQRSGRSQSTEAAMRLARSFEHQELLPEVVSLAYDKQAAGLFLLLAEVMQAAGWLHLDVTRRRYYADDPLHWTEDLEAFDNAVEAANTLLSAARPQAVQKRRKRRSNQSSSGRKIARDVIAAVVEPDDQRAAWLSVNEAAIRSLLGPIAMRMVSAPRTRMELAPEVMAVSRARQQPVVILDFDNSDAASKAAARAVLNLFASSLHPPSRETLAELIEQTLLAHGRTMGQEEGR